MVSQSPTRYWIVAWLCLASLYVACLGGFQTSPAFGDGPSIYVVSGQSLAHNTGYRLVNYPEPRPAQLYPIGYPFLLSLIFRAFPFGPTSIFLARLLAVASAIVWVEAGRRILLNIVGPLIAALAAIAMGLTPLTIEMSGQIKADLLFGAILMTAMVLAATIRASDTNKQFLVRAFALGALAAWAMLVRTIGFTLVFGLALDFLIRRRWRMLFSYGAAVALIFVPWMLWCAAHNGGTFNSYIAENIITWRTPISNFWTLATKTAPTMGLALFQTGAWTAIESRHHLAGIRMVLGLAITVLVIVGWASLIRQLHLVAIVLAAYMAIVFLWWWEPSRFVVPVLPLIVFCAAVGAKIVLAGLSLPRFKIGLFCAAICIAAGILVDGVALHHVFRYGDSGGAESADDWVQMTRGLAWIKQNTPANALVFTSYPAGVYLFTDRHTWDLNNSTHVGNVYTPTSTNMDMAPQLEKTKSFQSRYIFATERRDGLTNEEFGLAPVQRFMANHPGRLALQWASPNGKLFVYEVNAL